MGIPYIGPGQDANGPWKRGGKWYLNSNKRGMRFFHAAVQTLYAYRDEASTSKNHCNYLT